MADELAGATLPLTKSQSLILAGQLLQPQDPLYNMVLAFRISGRLLPARFQQAFQALVDGCDALRTVFVDPGPACRQRVLAQFAYQPQLVDFSAEPSPGAAVEHWVEQHCQKRFDLEQCLFESALLRLADDEHVWYLSQHHLLTDAWSVGVIFQQMQSLYALAGEGRLQEAAPLPNFSDYVLKESSSQATPLYEKAAAYWQEKLAQPFIPSSFYRQAPAQASGRTRRCPCALGPRRSSRLRALTDQDGFQAFTPDLSLMQVFATLLFAYLHRITGNSALSMGTPCHSRTSPRLKQTAGLLIEIFPLRIEVAESESFRTLFQKVSAANQELLMHALPGTADYGHQRVFDVLLNFIPSSFGHFDSLPVKSEWIHAEYGDRNHLLRLQVHNFDESDEFTLYFDLSETAFSGPEMDWVGNHFLVLLDAMLEDAEQAIAAPPLLAATQMPPYAASPALRRDSSTDEPTVLEMFGQQCRKSPEAVAVQCAGQVLSYAQLDERSSQLAGYLQLQGVGPGVVVALSMRRSIEAVVAVLGIMKSAGAFLPIDPAYPTGRAAFMLSDAGAVLLLTLAGSDLAAADLPLPLCRLDRDSDLIAAAAAAAPIPPRFDDIAYLIYTSGSTGQPKGVMVAHDSLANYIGWARGYYLEGEQLDFPLFSSLSFDLTITSLLVPLVSGGRLVVYPELDDASSIAIRQVIEDNRVDVIKLTPAHLTLIQAMDFSRSRLRKLIVGGEDFKADSARTLSQYFGDSIEIFNEYGPTEGTVACTVHRYDPAADIGVSVPIGRPISHAEIHILDGHMNRVPQGVTGEIYIGGVGVARGYLNRPELTDRRFIASPFQGIDTLYRTGDLARWNENGLIEYLGRNDHQVKIRGVRIETGEVEAALLTLHGVTGVCVDSAEHFPALDAGRVETYCSVCGLAGSHPSAQLDAAQVCRICRVYEQQAEQAQSYFRTLDELASRIDKIKSGAGPAQDCIMLLSGGKDSSYALCRLVDMGLTPLVFTLDNGYISDGAKDNIRRLVDKLGLELVVGETPAMNEIFLDSLSRHSNVCNGCFKTIYTLSMNLARERGIHCICTGLSRGQIFETRVAHLFQQGVFDADEIDRSIVAARKAYHRTEDVIARSLDVKIFEDDEIFEEIEYLDFYRYTDVTLEQMLEYLDSRAPWARPVDTGRSTNCLINDAGIHVHKTERGYHNYALPYSWDVRLGHKDRVAALAELDDEIDPLKVEKILGEIGYQPGQNGKSERGEDYLVAYYAAAREIGEEELRGHLAGSLPSEYLPREFFWLAEMPLTANGKLDRQAMPRPDRGRRKLTTEYLSPANDTEVLLARVWSQMLGLKDVGAGDNFFDLGGDSIINIQIVAAAREYGIDITPQQIFDYPTVRELAAHAGTVPVVAAEQGLVLGEVALLPGQRRFFASQPEQVNAFNQSVLLEYRGQLDPGILQQSLQLLLNHHDALRCSFTRTTSGWQQQVLEPEQVAPVFAQIDSGGVATQELESMLEKEARRQCQGLDVASGMLLAASLFSTPGQERCFLSLLVHHLVVDGVSWWILLGDLEHVYHQLAAGRNAVLPNKTSSIRQWAQALEKYSRSDSVRDSEAYWLRQTGPGGSILPPDTLATVIPRAGASVHSIVLGPVETRSLLQDVPAAYGVQVPELLLTALLQAVLPWSGQDALRLDLEGHGREDSIGAVDLMRSVAWFTSTYPLCLGLSESGTPGDDLKCVKEQLRAVPQRGLAYELLRYPSASPDVGSALRAGTAAPVLFNYMGQWGKTLAADSRFSFVRPIRAYQGHSGVRTHAWEINALVFDDQLHIDWTYNSELHPRALMEELGGRLVRALAELTDYCVTTGESGLTPSDFPSAQLSQHELDDLLAEFGEPSNIEDSP